MCALAIALLSGQNRGAIADTCAENLSTCTHADIGKKDPYFCMLKFKKNTRGKYFLSVFTVFWIFTFN